MSEKKSEILNQLKQTTTGTKKTATAEISDNADYDYIQRMMTETTGVFSLPFPTKIDKNSTVTTTAKPKSIASTDIAASPEPENPKSLLGNLDKISDEQIQTLIARLQQYDRAASPLLFQATSPKSPEPLPADWGRDSPITPAEAEQPTIPTPLPNFATTAVAATAFGSMEQHALRLNATPITASHIKVPIKVPTPKKATPPNANTSKPNTPPTDRQYKNKPL